MTASDSLLSLLPSSKFGRHRDVAEVEPLQQEQPDHHDYIKFMNTIIIITESPWGFKEEEKLA
jgi:hypothetical protein